jgi:hypothetical protein
MKTINPDEFPESMRNEIIRIDKEMQNDELWNHKLKTVLSEFHIFTDEFRVILAESALIWAFVSLGRCGKQNGCGKQNVCETLFRLNVEMCYLGTFEAEKRLTKAERVVQYQTVLTCRDNLEAHITPLLRESTQHLLNLPGNGMNRIVAEAIHQHRAMNSIEYATVNGLGLLIAGCFGLCTHLWGWESGLINEEDLWDKGYKVQQFLDNIEQYIVSKVENGDLRFDNEGRVVKS